MRLTKIKINNFRSFNNIKETVIDFNELTTFIGNNSTGKTAAIQALLKLFGEKDRAINRSDFHLPSNESPEEMDHNKLYIEAVFDFPNLDEEADPSVSIFFNHFVIDDVGHSPYLRIRLESTWEKGNTMEGTVDTNIYFITTPEEKEIEEKHKKPASNAILSNVKCLYVPATRNPNDQLKMVSGSILYRVLKGINWSEDITEDVKQKVKELNSVLFEEKGFDIVKNAIQTNWSSYHSESRYEQASLTFGESDVNSLLKSIGVKFSPTVTGRDFDVNELGDGLRSLFYFSLVNSLLEIEDEILSKEDLEKDAFNFKPPILTIVAVEEPENHIAPHLLGKVVKKLINISEKGNAQTVLTSHSPAIVKRVNSEDIRHFRISEKSSSIVKKIKLPDKKTDSYKFVKGAVEAYPELYFSELVVLGEGDSEEYVIKKVLDSSDLDIDSEGISVVPLGGRHVNHFWKLLNDLDIPHITLLDFDRERNGGGWGRIKYAIDQLIENGAPRDELLKLQNDTVLSDELFSKMHTFLLKDTSSIGNLIKRLEGFNVFFSYPLDLDFMLLESFATEYKESLGTNEGPRLKIGDETKKVLELTEEELSRVEYNERLKSDIRATLKKSGGEGETYSSKQKKLMLWYNYFFLSKSKPVTHMRAFANIEVINLIDKLPEPLDRLLAEIKRSSSDKGNLDFLE